MTPYRHSHFFCPPIPGRIPEGSASPAPLPQKPEAFSPKPYPKQGGRREQAALYGHKLNLSALMRSMGGSPLPRRTPIGLKARDGTEPDCFQKKKGGNITFLRPSTAKSAGGPFEEWPLRKPASIAFHAGFFSKQEGFSAEGFSAGGRITFPAPFPKPAHGGPQAYRAARPSGQADSRKKRKAAGNDSSPDQA